MIKEAMLLYRYWVGLEPKNERFGQFIMNTHPGTWPEEYPDVFYNTDDEAVRDLLISLDYSRNIN